MARAGRKRKPDAVRRKTTRVERRRIDAGTPEFQARRARSPSGRPARHPAAVGPYTQAQMDAGWIYAVMRWRAFGKPTPHTHIYTRYASGLTGRRDPDAARATRLP